MAYLELEGVPLPSLSGMVEGQDWLEMEPDLQEDQLAWNRVAVLCLELQGEAQVSGNNLRVASLVLVLTLLDHFFPLAVLS